MIEWKLGVVRRIRESEESDIRGAESAEANSLDGDPIGESVAEGDCAEDVITGESHGEVSRLQGSHEDGARAAGRLRWADVQLADGSAAAAVYETDLYPCLAAGDWVMLNTTAETLRLGSGGVHFVHAVLPVPDNSGGYQKSLERIHVNQRIDPQGGHIMKLRYTSLQRAVLAAEEPVSPHHAFFRSEPQALDGMPVFVGELHSMLPAAVCMIRRLQERSGREHPCRIAYVMSDGGSLPIAFSRHAAALGKLGWLAGTITYGHAYGGDLETVNKYTALLAAKHILHADMTIVAMGPGSVGTSTRLGFSGLETGEILNAVIALQGQPVIIPRLSTTERRERHFGISHHTLTVLRLIAQPGVLTPLPELEGGAGDRLRLQAEQSGIALRHHLEWIKVSSAAELETVFHTYPLPITSMGRGLRDDPAFFAGIEAAVSAGWSRWLTDKR
ncbi:DUF3866 family protein [Paenibacillus piri]|uniref:DUF3866 family protein n=1 Tax=Paenibacillus piri TaxID=2547395 RepID=A0A4R5KTN3_9BACL|nr:DUF3866 family protein [Paenibacillus piri]TDF99263.1 DUF3866 family protein [Paenibacillus piri]